MSGLDISDKNISPVVVYQLEFMETKSVKNILLLNPHEISYSYNFLLRIPTFLSPVVSIQLQPN